MPVLTENEVVANSSLGSQMSLRSKLVLQVGHSELDPYISPILQSSIVDKQFHWHGRNDLVSNLSYL